VSEAIDIRPQPGPQTKFLASKADIVIYGGAAGGGKTYGLLMEPLRHVRTPGFQAVVLRRTSKQLTKAGGPWDESYNLYPAAGGVPKETTLEWSFGKSRVSMGHIEHDKDLDSWLGAQICLLLFDQLETFTERMFFYMLSRNRSACGVRPYVRATCNPDPRSWLAKFVSWWIDPDTGYPNFELAGKVRWMVRIGRDLHWFDTRAEAVRYCLTREVKPDLAQEMPKSVTFIPATVEDNKILQSKDPGYKANLLALPPYDRERLFGGNWKDRSETGEFPFHWFDNRWFEEWPLESALVLKTLALDPSKGKSDKTGDYSAYVKLAIDRHDVLYVQANMRRRPINQMVADGVEIYRDFRPTAFGIEGNAWQDLLQPDFQQEFKTQGVLAPEVWILNNSVNKDVRIRRLGGYLAHDRIRFKSNCPDTQLLIDQCLDFPSGDHDDGCDALEMAIRLAEQLTMGTQ
jgi:predicted phage terminase large subunit-like protein